MKSRGAKIAMILLAALAFALPGAWLVSAAVRVEEPRAAIKRAARTDKDLVRKSKRVLEWLEFRRTCIREQR